MKKTDFDTIAAICTGPGGSIGIVRISGPEAKRILSSLWEGRFDPCACGIGGRQRRIPRVWRKGGGITLSGPKARRVPSRRENRRCGEQAPRRPGIPRAQAGKPEFFRPQVQAGRRLVTFRALLLLCPATLAAHPGTKKPKTPARPMRGAFLHVSRRIRKKNGRKPASFTMHRALYAKRLCAAQRCFRFFSASAAQDTGLPSSSA